MVILFSDCRQIALKKEHIIESLCKRKEKKEILDSHHAQDDIQRFVLFFFRIKINEKMKRA